MAVHLAADILTSAPHVEFSAFKPDELQDAAMNGRVPRSAGEGVDIQDDVAWRDDRIAELECSQRRLQPLFDISTLLTRFESFEPTVAEVFVLIADALPLRSAIVILETGESPSILAGKPPVRMDAGWKWPRLTGRRYTAT